MSIEKIEVISTSDANKLCSTIKFLKNNRTQNIHVALRYVKKVAMFVCIKIERKY